MMEWSKMPDKSMLESLYGYRNQMVHCHKLPSRKAHFGRLTEDLPPPLRECLRHQGIELFYEHQVQAIEAIRAGKSVVIVTSTSSGKTLCYNIPALESLIEDPTSRALYIYPTKALAQDQLRVLVQFQKDPETPIPFKAGTYDGDTPPNTRRSLRSHAQIILTNPDMLHQGILPNHSRWVHFFARLKYVVVDELHTYRGIFGSNFANVIRRLKRIAQHYGADPQFICCSATISNPEQLATKILHQPVEIITADGSPTGEKDFIFWNPPLISTDQTALERRSSNIECQDIFTRLVKDNIQTIAFSKTRISAELILKYCRETLSSDYPRLAKSIRAYRGGYLPEQRREIEQGLATGKILGVSSTNALELGIDIGSLQAALIVGYPGTITSTWQQAGRAGRKTGHSLVVFIAHNTPIDQYLMQHPEYFFEQNPESAVVVPENPYILLGHLRCAAHELPINLEKEEETFGEYTQAVLEVLEEAGELMKLQDKYYFSRTGFPAADFSLRNISEDTYTIIDVSSDKENVIGSIDGASAFTQLHTEAVYLHEAETYFVQKLDLEKKCAYVKKAALDYYTQGISETHIHIDGVDERKPFREAMEIFFGDVSVTSVPIMFKKIKFGSRDSIGYGPLDLPAQTLFTMAAWLVPSMQTLSEVRKYGRLPESGLWGIANVIVDILPLFSMCDSTDIGAVVDSSNTGTPAIFIYDRFIGGLGFAQKAYQIIEQILEAALSLIKACPCQEGCLSCVGSPRPQYSRIDPDPDRRAAGLISDKEAARIILHSLLGKEPYIPKIHRQPKKEKKQKEANGKKETHPQAEKPQSLPPRKERKILPSEVEKKLRERILILKKRLKQRN